MPSTKFLPEIAAETDRPAAGIGARYRARLLQAPEPLPGTAGTRGRAGPQTPRAKTARA